MQDEGVKAFKNELANYRFYQKQIRELTDKISDLYDDLGGVRGVDPSREPLHFMPNKDWEYAIRDEITRQEAKRYQISNKLNLLDEILDRVEISLKRAIIDVYADGMTLKKISAQMYMAESTLRRHINKAIKKALD